MPMEDTFSPVLHRIDQAIRWRAVHPTEEIPPPYEILTKYSAPPAELVKQAQPRIEALRNAADLKKGDTHTSHPFGHCTNASILQSPRSRRAVNVAWKRPSRFRVSMSTSSSIARSAARYRPRMQSPSSSNSLLVLIPKQRSPTSRARCPISSGLKSSTHWEIVHMVVPWKLST